MKPTIYQQISELEQLGEPFVVCSIVGSRGSTPRRTGSKMIVKQNGDILGSVGGGEIEERVRQEALIAIEHHQTKMVHYQLTDPQRGDPGICGGEVDIFIEPVGQVPKIVIVGAGHVGKAVAHLAKWSGFKIAVSDDRPELGNTIEDADEMWIGPIEQTADHIRITEDSFIILTTRNADLDIEGIPVLIKTPATYLGVIGSKRRWLSTLEGLAKKGIDGTVLEKVHTPIGLKIGAETPEEIAISIMAEIIQIWRQHVA